MGVVHFCKIFYKTAPTSAARFLLYTSTFFTVSCLIIDKSHVFLLSEVFFAFIVIYDDY